MTALEDLEEKALLTRARALKQAHPTLFGEAEGILVTRVLPEGQGARAGLRPGDILTGYASTPLSKTSQLKRLTGEHSLDSPVTLTYLRGPEQLKAVILGGSISVGMRDLAGTPLDRMNALIWLGETAMQGGRYQDALVHFGQGLEIAEAVDNKRFRGAFLDSISKVYRSLGKYETALEYNTEALKIHRGTGDRRGESADLGNIGNMYLILDQSQKALDHYQEVLAIRREIGDRLGEGSTLSNIGIAYQNIGQYQKALEHYKKALEIRREIGDRYGEGTDLGNIGNMYLILSQYQKALEQYQEALAIRREIGDRLGEGSILGNIGIAYQNLSQYQRALEHYQKALAIDREIGDRRGEGADHSNIGIMYQNLNQYQKALEHYHEALGINREFGYRRSVGADLSSIGNMYTRLGQYQKALECLREALAIDREIGDQSREGGNLSNIGIVYGNLGQYQKALEHFQGALAIHREISDRHGEGVDLGNIGIEYMNLGQYHKALEDFREALAIKRAIGDRSGEGNTLGNIGMVYDDLGQYQKALEHHQEALVIHQEISDWRGKGSSLSNIGGVYVSLGQYQKALERFQEALAIQSVVGAPEFLWRTWDNMRQVFEDQHQPTVAILTGKQAVNTLQNMRSSSTGLDMALQKSFLENKTHVYQGLADLLIDQGRLPEAQQVLAMLKEEEYFDFIRRAPIDDPRMTRIRFNAFENEQKEKIESVSNRLTELYSEIEPLKRSKGRTGAEEARLAALRDSLENTGQQFRETLQSVIRAFEQLDETRKSVLAKTLDDLDKRDLLKQLGPHTALVDYLVLKDKLSILLTTVQAISAYCVDITQDHLNQEVQALRSALLDPRIDPRPAAQTLYRALIAPIEAGLEEAGVRTLMVSATGGIRYIPVAALHNGQQYLTERLAVVMYTAAAQEEGLLMLPQEEPSIVGLGVSQAHGNFRALPAVPQELEGIVRHTATDPDGVITGDIYLDQAFTAQLLETELATKRPLLHLASHFQFNPGTDADSFLLLGDGRHLSLREMREGDYSFDAIDMVTLSACETAVDIKDLDGQEIESLGTLVQRKGAKGVLATLWSVADTSTSTFMRRFYQTWAEQDLTKAEALRRVQLVFLNGDAATPEASETRGVRLADDGAAEFAADGAKPYAHPYYWAPFILMGNWL